MISLMFSCMAKVLRTTVLILHVGLVYTGWRERGLVGL